jgi:IS6 family transposase
MKRYGALWRPSQLRQCKYLNNIVEQDRRRVKRPTGLGLGFGSLRTARPTLAGFDAVAMMRKGQSSQSRGCDVNAQRAFVAESITFNAPDPFRCSLTNLRRSP